MLRAVGLFDVVRLKLAARTSDSTIAAAFAASIGRYSSVIRLRATSRCGASSRDRTLEGTFPRGAPLIIHVTDRAESCR